MVIMFEIYSDAVAVMAAITVIVHLGIVVWTNRKSKQDKEN